MGEELFTEEKNIKLDIGYITNVVQQILDKSHTHPAKRQIKLRPNESNPKELNFSCPICGDSHDRMNMKRGHLHLRNMFYVCYNEKTTCSRSFDYFCKHFGVQLDPEKKMEIYDYVKNNLVFEQRDDFTLDALDKILDAKEYMEFLNNKPKSFLTHISTIRKDSLAWDYLRKRKIINHSNILQGIYHITEKWKEPVIIILNRRGNKLLGFQLRNLRDDPIKRIYHEKEFEFLYNYKNPDNKLDELEAISYNKLSHLFNILNVDFNQPVNAFEGYIDSTFFPNSISLIGLDTDISIINNDSIDLRFVFDNDEPGLRKAKKMLKDGKTVFLWRKLIDDLAKGDYAYRNELNHMKDINRLVQLLDNPNIYYDLNLENYFSRDRFDMIYLEDIKKEKPKKIQSSDWDNIIL